tara:strand:- start:11933 stop:12370 length:438 start_codon:yes stop_codon:yes gene_type:complete
MCLTIYKKEKDYGSYNHLMIKNENVINNYGKISKKNIKVYKRLKRSDNSLYTPYQNTFVDCTGNLLIENDFSFNNHYLHINVNIGIHAHINKNAAIRNKAYNEIIIECIIPAETIYFEGIQNDIVSLILIIPPIKLKKHKTYYGL